MSEASVAAAIERLENAINEGEHTCDVHVEEVGEMKEVSFYLDGESVQDGEPVGTVHIVTPRSEEAEDEE